MHLDARALARRLTGGMAVEEFDARVREQRAKAFANALDAREARELFSLSRLGSLLASEAVPLAYVDLFEDGHLEKLADVQRKSGRSGLGVIADSFRRGSTIRVRDVDRFDPRLDRFVGEVQRCYAARSQVNVYLTPPDKAGFPSHFDITDVFVLQVGGSKEWEVFDDYTNRVELPSFDVDWDPERFRPSGVARPLTLRPGDVLYLPRGVMHRAFCTALGSLHLTISLVPLTFADLLGRAVARLAAADVELRRRVPWSVDGEGPADEGTSSRLRALLAGLADRVDVGELLEVERRALLGESAADPRDDLESAIGSLLEPTPRDAPTGAPRAASDASATEVRAG